MFAAVPASAAEDVDPLEIVQSQGLLQTEAAPPVVDESAAQRSQPGATAQTSVQPLTISPVSSIEGTKMPEAAATVIEDRDFGFVTGIGTSGTNASFVVIENDNAPDAYEFAIGDASHTLVAGEDGSVQVFDSDGQIVNYLMAPWARDADGVELPTWYTIEGNIVTQHVDTSNAACPVVADPTFGCGVGWCSVYFNRTETTRIAAGGAVAAGVLAVGCGLVGTPVAGAACLAASGAIVVMVVAAESTQDCVGIVGYGVPAVGLGGFAPFIHDLGDTHCR